MSGGIDDAPDEDDEDAEDEFHDEPDTRSLSEIASEDAEALYAAALDSGDVRSFEEDEEAPAYACCFIENAKGEKGWAVIVARGFSWEGLEIDVAKVFKSEKKADDYIWGRICDDEDEYRKRMEEEEEEDGEEDGDEDGDEDGEEAADE